MCAPSRLCTVIPSFFPSFCSSFFASATTDKRTLFVNEPSRRSKCELGSAEETTELSVRRRIRHWTTRCPENPLRRPWNDRTPVFTASARAVLPLRGRVSVTDSVNRPKDRIDRTEEGTGAQTRVRFSRRCGSGAITRFYLRSTRCRCSVIKHTAAAPVIPFPAAQTCPVELSST